MYICRVMQMKRSEEKIKPLDVYEWLWWKLARPGPSKVTIKKRDFWPISVRVVCTCPTWHVSPFLWLLTVHKLTSALFFFRFFFKPAPADWKKFGQRQRGVKERKEIRIRSPISLLAMISATRVEWSGWDHCGPLGPVSRRREPLLRGESVSVFPGEKKTTFLKVGLQQEGFGGWVSFIFLNKKKPPSLLARK